MSWVYQDFENYRVRNISTGLMYVIYNPVDVEGILSSICLIYPWFYDELIFIIVVIMCFHMETFVTDIFVTQ